MEGGGGLKAGSFPLSFLFRSLSCSCQPPLYMRENGTICPFGVFFFKLYYLYSFLFAPKLGIFPLKRRVFGV